MNFKPKASTPLWLCRRGQKYFDQVCVCVCVVCLHVCILYWSTLTDTQTSTCTNRREPRTNRRESNINRHWPTQAEHTKITQMHTNSYTHTHPTQLISGATYCVASGDIIALLPDLTRRVRVEVEYMWVVTITIKQVFGKLRCVCFIWNLFCVVVIALVQVHKDLCVSVCVCVFVSETVTVPECLWLCLYLSAHPRVVWVCVLGISPCVSGCERLCVHTKYSTNKTSWKQNNKTVYFVVMYTLPTHSPNRISS